VSELAAPEILRLLLLCAAAGALFGLLALGVSGLYMLPLVAHLMGPAARRRLWGLVLLALVLGAAASVGMRPYSEHRPKRILLQHVASGCPARLGCVRLAARAPRSPPGCCSTWRARRAPGHCQALSGPVGA
jgi:hypothetical protein